MFFDANNKSAHTVASIPTRISETGAYVGSFRDVYYYQTPSGAGMVHFDFVEDGTNRPCAITTCITKKDGTDTFSRAILDAVMVVCRIGKIATRPVTIKCYNGSTKGVERLEALCGERVGVLLQRENSDDDRYPYRMNLITPFDPETRMIAAEIIDKATEPKLLDQKMKTLKDRTAKPRTLQAAKEFESPMPNFDDMPL